MFPLSAPIWSSVFGCALVLEYPLGLSARTRQNVFSSIAFSKSYSGFPANISSGPEFFEPVALSPFASQAAVLRAAILTGRATGTQKRLWTSAFAATTDFGCPVLRIGPY